MSERNKYLVFNIENEYYAISIDKVQEVIQYTPITPLHETSSFLKGVINLRGKIIPIIDMRLKFGLKEKEYNERTIFIIIEVLTDINKYSIGIAVDSVYEVVEIENSKIEKTPEIGFKFKSHYLYGIIQINNNMCMILNIDNILTTEEIIEIENKNIDNT